MPSPGVQNVAGGVGPLGCGPALNVLEAEEGLNLVPDREAEKERVEEKSREEDPVALASPASLTLVLHAGVPLRPLPSDPTLDCG